MELESQQLEGIRSIRKVALDPSRQTEDDTALALSDSVRDMRPKFDDGFVAYLKYAVAEEERRLAQAGILDDPKHNQWLFVPENCRARSVCRDSIGDQSLHKTCLVYPSNGDTNRKKDAFGKTG